MKPYYTETSQAITFEQILERFHARPSGADWMARCLAHDDGEAPERWSLSLAQKNGKILLHCHAGCDTKDVLRAASLRFEDLQEGPRIVATYDYKDEHGQLLFQVVRYEPKTFSQALC